MLTRNLFMHMIYLCEGILVWNWGTLEAEKVWPFCVELMCWTEGGVELRGTLWSIWHWKFCVLISNCPWIPFPYSGWKTFKNAIKDTFSNKPKDLFRRESLSISLFGLFSAEALNNRSLRDWTVVRYQRKKSLYFLPAIEHSNPDVRRRTLK